MLSPDSVLCICRSVAFFRLEGEALCFDCFSDLRRHESCMAKGIAYPMCPHCHDPSEYGYNNVVGTCEEHKMPGMRKAYRKVVRFAEEELDEIYAPTDNLYQLDDLGIHMIEEELDEICAPAGKRGIGPTDIDYLLNDLGIHMVEEA